MLNLNKWKLGIKKEEKIVPPFQYKLVEKEVDKFDFSSSRNFFKFIKCIYWNIDGGNEGDDDSSMKGSK